MCNFFGFYGFAKSDLYEMAFSYENQWYNKFLFRICRFIFSWPRCLHKLIQNYYKLIWYITYFHNYLARAWEKPFLVVDSYGKIYKPSNTKTLTSVPRRIFIINVMYLPKGIYFASPFADERLEPEDIEKSWDISSSFLILSWDIHR